MMWLNKNLKNTHHLIMLRFKNLIYTIKYELSVLFCHPQICPLSQSLIHIRVLDL
jgi:hypothetical protein